MNKKKSRPLTKKKLSAAESERKKTRTRSKSTAQLKMAKVRRKAVVTTIKSESRDQSNDIAIIGMAGFFPGSTSIEDFCSKLTDQKSLFGPIPANHFPDQIIRERYGAFIDDIDLFDAELFKIAPVEAEYMDPRQRLLLMAVWHALEDACYLPSDVKDDVVNVYMASEGAPYLNFVAQADLSPYSTLAGNSWPLPNRISNAFKFRGKSLLLDTACSGSSVALHEAIQCLRKNDADYAVVGAANLLFGQNALGIYVAQEAMGILGNSVTCYPFQQNAAGFLPAEGVVTLLLKKLSRAIRDEDHIHAVLLGSHVNHVGGYGSLTMPSADSQSDAIVKAYQDAAINPITVSYIEAHGASTLLADTEEINAFKLADKKFAKYCPASAEYPCKLSTIKANIGHANSVSGLMSLVRVIHSLKIKKKLGIKDFSGYSDQIDLGKTRFYINDKNESWDSLLAADGGELPRRAAINNFGAGGVNAHILVEEFDNSKCNNIRMEITPPTKQENKTVYFLAISAHSEEQLVQYTDDIASFLNEKEDIYPNQLEYLYFNRRTFLPQRLVLRYKSIDELKLKLDQYIQAGGKKGYFFKNNINDENATAIIFQKYPKLSNFLNTLNTETDKSILFELWTYGIESPIKNYYKDISCHKQSLPRYPFKLEKFWVEPSQKMLSRSKAYNSKIHPLVHENKSNLLEQRFSSTLTGEEFFLAEHVVKGKKILPGVATLEMVRAAIRQALVDVSEETLIMTLKNIVWPFPIVAGKSPKEIQIALSAQEGEDENYLQIQFEVTSMLEAQLDNEQVKTLVHAQGVADLAASVKNKALELTKLRSKMDCGIFSAEQTYQAFQSVGINHGLSFQGVEEIYLGKNEVLARLCLPSSVLNTLDQYILHPSLLDSATQTYIALAATNKSTQNRNGVAAQIKPFIPFALESVEILGSCTEHMFCWLRFSDGYTPLDKVQKLDIDLCDTQGNICVAIKGATARVLDGKISETKTTNTRPKQATLAVVEESKEGLIADNEQVTFREKAQDYVKRQVASTLKLPAHKIQMNAPLEDYGIDSMLVIELTNQLEKVFGSLSKTLFFEYQSLAELSEYFIESYADKLSELLKLEKATAIGNSHSENSTALPQPAKNIRDIVLSKPVLQKGLAKRQNSEQMEIAIIGLSGRYPQARDIDEYWQNLRDGKDCITEVPPERWDWRQYYTEDRSRTGVHYSKWGGFIGGVDEFDPLFFNISPREAEIMDPQERLFLEHVWMTVEDAGYTKESLAASSGKKQSSAGQVGVYVGAMYGEYQLFGAEESARGNRMALASSLASIANRVSYTLNLRGPSIMLDTMCSSSLTAINFACQDLQLGRTSMGIAGGVNVTIHPNKYLMLSSGQFISTKGRCESFGEGGGGYIPAEGVGVVLLKPLANAEQDGDHIYGVIKGCAVNHGGKTNGYFVPNPNAQQSAIETALNEAQVDPRGISYIEAHGTGTRLGDPIEVAALTKAFRKRTEAVGFCLLGSAKSNIGHCEPAAGMAGLTKVLLQMRYGQVAPSLHSSTLNPNIDFDNTPFIVNQTLKDWERPVIDGKEIPRIAGISSFGAGGANAHLLIEEYCSTQLPTLQNKPVIVPLSAKNKPRLHELASRLLTFIRRARDDQHSLNLVDLAFTLQTGREVMQERLGLIVSSLAELEEKLTGYLAGKEDIEDLYLGHGKRNSSTFAEFTHDEDLQNAMEAWIRKGKYSKLLHLWVKGLIFDWNKLYGAIKPQRISVPTYPFARERYWVQTQSLTVSSLEKLGRKSRLHPLLQENTSDLSEQRFSSTFTGEEFFLKDHQIKGEKVLPGVAYLEMAQAAVKLASGAIAEDNQTIQLKNVVWIQPFLVGDQPIDVNIGLLPEESGEIAYKIYSDHPTQAENTVIYSQGVATLRASSEVPALNLSELQKKLNQYSFSPQDCYKAFKDMGLDYGPAHRGLEQVYFGSNEVLAKLALPSSVLETKASFTLHPSLLDAALQASIGMSLGQAALHGRADSATLKPSLPFALDGLDIIDNCVESMWAWLRYSDGSAASNAIQKIDIDLCDDAGKISVKLRGFSSRVFGGEIAAQPEAIDTLMVKPVWLEKSIDHSQQLMEYIDHQVLLCGLNQKIQELQEASPDIIFTDLHCNQKTLEQQFEAYSLKLFEIIQTVFQSSPKDKVLIQVLVPAQGSKQVFSALSGLLKTARLENRNLCGQMIALDDEATSEDLIHKLQQNSQCPEDQQIRYEGGKRKVYSFDDVAISEKDPYIPWKEGGVYLITGGAGGLGLIFAEEIGAKVESATLILTGRAELNEVKQARFKELESAGVNIDYKSVDVSDSSAVEVLVRDIQDKFGGLNGIIHSAGVINDNLILKKKQEEFKQVLAPKVAGVMNLDQASKALDLDFFVLFSSGAGVTGNIGQADYSTANAFMDAFAKYRNSMSDLQERKGHTLSINWPLWREGSMKVDKATEQMMKESLGMVAMETASGIKAFYQGMASNQSQVMVMEGLIKRMKEKLLLPPPKRVTGKSKPSLNIDTDDLLEKIQQILMQVISDVLKLKIEDLDINDELSEYGFDSITLTDFANQLNKTYQLQLTPMAFFEYPTIASFAKYLVEEHPGVFAEQFTVPTQDRNVAETKDLELEKDIGKSKHRSRFARTVIVEGDLIPKMSSHKEKNLIQNIQSQYPELIHLNEKTQGHPVFWIHDISGGVQPYYRIAVKSQRPFYGIQARGWRTERSPLLGIQAMVAYYIHIIQSVQPEGPYDLGGFSLGGLLCYEVVRQLQEFGQRVNTVTMLDTPILNGLKMVDPCLKSELLGAANFELLSTIMPDPRKMSKTLIHRDELDANLDDKAFLNQLTALAKKRGLKKTQAEWKKTIEQIVKVRSAYEIQRYSILPLLDPQGINCYYFRNKNGLFYGELAPFYKVNGNEITFENVDYWSGWKKQLPNFHIMDIESSNHMMILSEPKAYKPVIDFCKNLYSKKGISQNYLKSLQREIESKSKETRSVKVLEPVA